MIDSPWSTRYNDFIVDEERYPNPKKFFLDLQERGYRVVLWMTPNVNRESKDTQIRESEDWFQEAADKGYLTGDPPTSRRWWKGEGGFIDYTNPEAMTWWRGLQQQLFDWGLDGWKLDGTDPYFGRQMTHAGEMNTRGFADHYYRDEYVWGLTQNPEFVTLSRSVDGPIHPNGFAPLDAAPVTWVGDQDHTWSLEDEGLEEALSYIFRAADLGYAVIGSDVGGYGGRPIPKDVYIRWAQFSAFCGLFLNGGHGERMLWKRTPEELEIIRKFAWLHNELVPYIYTHVVECHRGGPTLMQPIDGDYQYLFGDDFLVAPIYRDSPERTVKLPRGRWRYLFDDTEVIKGPKTITRDYPLDEAPVYVREGAVVPLNVSRAYTGFGDASSASHTTWLVYPGDDGAFELHHPDGSGDTTLRMSKKRRELRLEISGDPQPHVLRVHTEKAPARVTRDGLEIDWLHDSDARVLWIREDNAENGTYLVAF
jgi:alpha-glucosidase (family GH31 glycosyl hydrolase)